MRRLKTRVITRYISFNSRTPGGVRLEHRVLVAALGLVSIHAPREGCDLILSCIALSALVSIHAPREGCDLTIDAYSSSATGFNSRTPGGVRPARATICTATTRFQFTHPGRGATMVLICLKVYQMFQFTHPGRGATFPSSLFIILLCRFNSRTPGGVRPCTAGAYLRRGCFNSRTPGGVRPERERSALGLSDVSIHAPREGCDSVVQSCVLWGG